MTDHPKLGINIDVGAKAELKAEIPASASGNLINALTDLIRPISERRGLRADMLRLQREEVLIEIAKRARARLEIERAPIEPIPNKFLIPFLEKASLEDPDDEFMIEMWSQLLAGAATRKAARNNRFVSIMEELNGRQANLLRSIITGGYSAGSIRLSQIHDGMFYVNQSGIKNTIESLDSFSNLTEFGTELLKTLHVVGVAVEVVQVTDAASNEADDFVPDNRIYSDDKQLDFEILESLFLLKKIELKDIDKVHNSYRYKIDAFYYICTYLSLELFSACNPDWFLPERTESEIASFQAPDA